MTISQKTIGPALAMAVLAGCATPQQPQSTADLEAALAAKKAQTASDVAYAKGHNGMYPEELRGVKCDAPTTQGAANSAVAGAADMATGAATNSAGSLLGQYLPSGASTAISGAFSGASGVLKGTLSQASDAMGITNTAANIALCNRIADLNEALAAPAHKP